MGWVSRENIAKRLGVSRRHVDRTIQAFKDLGFEPCPNRYEVEPGSLEEKMAWLYLNSVDGVSVKQIAKMFGYSRQAIYDGFKYLEGFADVEEDASV